MEAKINQLAPVEDFDKAYIIAQYAHEQGFRGTTFPELLSWLQTRLDLTGTDLIDPTPPGTEASPAVIPPGPAGKKGKFEPSPGFYQGFPEVTGDRRWYFYWDGSSWSLVDMGELPEVQGKDVLNPIGEDLPKEKAVARYSPSKASVGILQFEEGENILQNLTESSINDDSIWTFGFVSKNTGSEGVSETQLKKTDFIPVSYQGTLSFEYKFVLQGNAGVCFYDEDRNFITAISTGNATATIVEGVFELTPQMKFIRVSHHATSDTSHILFAYEEDSEIATSNVFIKSEDKENIENESAIKAKGMVVEEVPLLSEVGISKINEGDVVYPEVTGSLFTDAIWHDGYLHKDDGEPRLAGTYKYSDRIPILGGFSFDYQFYFIGNAGVCFYDENGGFISSISNPDENPEFSGTSVTPVPARFIAFTQSINRGPEWTVITANEPFRKKTSETFLLSSQAEMLPKIDEVGVRQIEIGSNIIIDVTESDFDNENIWNSGFMHKDDGAPRSSGTYMYTNPWPIKGGVAYNFELYLTGNAAACFYDSNGAFISSISNPSTSLTLIGVYTTPENAVSIALSQNTVRNPSYTKVLSTTKYREATSRVFALAGTGGKDAVRETLNIYAPKRISRPIVSFISDDGAVQNEWFLSVLDEHDVKATFAIITGRFDNPGFYSKQQVKDLILYAGHEIAGHTVDHDTDNRLASLDEDGLHHQIGTCLMTLRGMDDRIRPTNFISPWGSRNSLVDKVVSQYFDHNFITVSSSNVPSGDFINQPPIDSFVIKRVSFDTPNGDQGQSNIENLKLAIDRLESDGGWVVFAIHPQYAEYQTTNPVDRRQEMRDLISYIQGKGIPILTAGQAALHYNNTKIGDRRVDAKYYEIGVNGVAIGNLF